MAVDNRSESNETTSTSLVEDSLNISFENLSYKVRHGFLAGGRKTILNGISGQFHAGELSAIIGKSGAGKSTLMDLLAGYTKPTSGRICVNGRIRNEKLFRRRSCYILQDNMIHDTLTIRESLKIAAELKLGNHVSGEQKHRRVEEVITSLGVSQVQHTKAGNLSGGQKKRLAIGLELVSDPPVMFLDEPTSGLDCSISMQLVYLLYRLARQGRTVVISMHQPSASLLTMVDRLYAIVAGRCAYMGSVPLLLTYLKQMELVCPPYHNSVDFLIEVCMDEEDKLVELSRNGKSEEWIQNNPNETDRNLMEYNKCKSEEVCLTILPPPKEDPTSKILLALKSTYPTSAWKQFIILTRRALLSNWHNPDFTLMFMGIHCCMALLVGFLYYNIGEDARYMADNYKYLYYCLMFLMFTAFSSVSITFPQQIPVIRREHFNRWYSTGAYFASVVVATLPIQTASTLTFAGLSYWLTGQPIEFIRFMTFCCTLLLVSYVALCVGYLNGSIFNIKHGVVFGNFFVMPFTIFSGFFLQYKDAPSFARWLYHISFLKHGLTGLVIAIFGMDRPKLPCSDLYCHYIKPIQFVKDYGFLEEKFSIAMAALIVIGFVFIVCAYIVLKIRLKNKW